MRLSGLMTAKTKVNTAPKPRKVLEKSARGVRIACLDWWIAQPPMDEVPV
jgi:hypothetical protein